MAISVLCCALIAIYIYLIVQVHSKNFNVGIQALMLLDKISLKNQIVSDRFYRSLYSKLLLPAVMNSSKASIQCFFARRWCLFSQYIYGFNSLSWYPLLLLYHLTIQNSSWCLSRLGFVFPIPVYDLNWPWISRFIVFPFCMVCTSGRNVYWTPSESHEKWYKSEAGCCLFKATIAG